MDNNKIFEKMFKNMSYDTYKNIEMTSFFAPAIANTANFFIDGALASSSIYAFTFLSLYYFVSTTMSFAEIYTKDIKEIKEIYNELIKDYAILIEDFDFRNPIEIYALYNYMLYNGYLSKTENYKQAEPLYGDIFSLLGANIVTGTGLCRHDASFLSDVYNKVGIDSQVLPIYLNTNETTVYEIKNFITILEIELKTTTDQNRKKEIYELIKIYKDKLKNIKSKFEPLKKRVGNHVITLSSYEGNCYFVDPTNEIMYKKSNLDFSNDILNQYLVSNKTGLVKIAKSGLFNHKLDKDATRKKLDLTETGEFEDNNIFSFSTKLCEENEDIIDIFRNQHIGLYNELDNKLSKIKTKKLIK